MWGGQLISYLDMVSLRITTLDDENLVDSRGQNKVDDLTFINKLNGNYLFFSKLNGRLYLIPQEKIHFLKNAVEKIPKSLIDSGLFTKKEIDVSKEINGKNPKNVYINLTTDCNLNCSYCFSFGGKEKYRIKEELIFDFLDQLSLTKRKINLLFQGGGEQTLEFELLKKTISYAKKKIPEVYIYLFTNGVLSENVCNWIIGNIDWIGLSIDGPPEIQDKQRPLKNGKASSPYVERTVERLIEKNKGFLINSVITNLSIGKEEKIIKYFHNLKAEKVAFEIANNYGKVGNKKIPSIKRYLSSLLKLYELGEETGIKVFFKGIKKSGVFLNNYCTVSKFCLNVNGEITICPIISKLNMNETSKKLVIGDYNSDGEFEFQENKMDLIRNRFFKMEKCKKCNYIWLCGTGCPLMNLRKNNSIYLPDEYTCSLIKQRYKKYFTYQAKKYFLRKKPYLEYKDGKFYFKLFFNDFKLDKIENDVANGSSFIQITNLKKLDDILEKIKYLKPIDKIDLFLLSFHLQKSEFNLSTGKKIIEFLNSLKKSKKYFKVTKPLPKRCLFGENWEKIFEKYEIPKTCFECLELFFLENNDIIFCNGKKGGKFDEAKDRREIYDKFIELKTRKEPENCNDCIYKIRKSCDGIWYS